MIIIEFCNDVTPAKFGTTENEDLCVEDVIVVLCKKLNISPLCQYLYGLKNIVKSKSKSNYELWLHLSKKLSDLPIASSYQFRIRYIPQSNDGLRNLESNSYTYLFYQVRHDFLSGNLPEHTQQPKDGLGLVVTDIVHHLLLNNEKKLSDLDISTFMPKNLKSLPNKYNVKSTTDSLFKNNGESYNRKGPEYIRRQYLEKVEEIGRPGGYEKYCIELDEGTSSLAVDLFIDPFHSKYPGLYYQTSKKTAHHMCKIEELVFVSVRKQDLTVELSRENGIPCYFSVSSLDVLESLVSCLSGYYRLMKTWTFDLCRELPTPSLGYLRSNKCHGPVGGSFAIEKIKKKSGGDSGVGLLRMSSKDYDVYKLTVAKKSSDSVVEALILTSDGKVHFKDSEEKHETLQSLIKWAIDSQFLDLGLRRILPPSDLDRPEQLLLLAAVDITNLAPINSGPRVLNMEQFIVKNRHPMKGRFSNVYHVRWSGESRDELAIKIPKLLKEEKDEFLECLNKFLFVDSSCLVKVFGVTLNPLSLVMEYLSLGPLSTYLTKRAKQIRQVDLIEAASYLAKALWDLHSKNVIHHNIRCHNVFVAEHTDQRFMVKLGDPGKVEYSWNDIHWLPREHIEHPPSALTDPQADVWAFATTLWEIFSLGQAPLCDSDIGEVKALYSKGFLLCKPHLCPRELYQVMLGCWHPDPHSRKHPQAIMRDVNQIFYCIFNSRRENQYQRVKLTYTNVNTSFPEEEEENSDAINTLELDDHLSVSTQMTSLTQSDGTVSEVKFGQVMDYPLIPLEIALPEPQSPDNVSLKSNSPKKSTMTLKDLLVPPTFFGSSPSVIKTPPPIEMNNCSIEIVKPIGKGNYGYVFQGRRVFRDKSTELVALKRLQSVGNSTDFKKEMDIMKHLQHENIVQFHCLAESDQEGTKYQYMVMEYLSLGSLQDYLVSNKTDPVITSDKRLLGFAIDIAKGMDYLESQQIIHRDLAARNVLVASENRVKITDFGLAQRPNHGNYYILRTVREMPIRWYALESIERGKFSHKSDVWSYGVTVWEMFTLGLVPDLPNDGAQLIQALKNGTRLVCKSPCKPFIYSKLIHPCWDEDPHMRPEFSKLISTATELQEEL